MRNIVETRPSVQGRRGNLFIAGTAGVDAYLTGVPHSTKEKDYAQGRLITLGHGGANVAATAASLGEIVELHTPLGTDPLSYMIPPELARLGVTLVPVEDPNYETPYSSIIIFADGQRKLTIHGPKDYTHPPLSDVHRKLLSEAGVLFESSQKGNVTIATSERLQIARERRIPVIFAPGKAQIENAQADGSPFPELLDTSSLFFLNEHETEVLLGTSTTESLVDRIITLRDMGPDNVVVTRGENGALFIEPSGDIYETAGFPESITGEEPSDGTGGGDRFAGTASSRLKQGLPLTRAVEEANAHGRAAVEDIGAQANLLPSERLTQIVDKQPNYKSRLIYQAGPKPQDRHRTTII